MGMPGMWMAQNSNKDKTEAKNPQEELQDDEDEDMLDGLIGQLSSS